MIEVNNCNKAIDNIALLVKNLIKINQHRNFDIVQVHFYNIFDTSYGTTPRLLNNGEILTYINVPNDDDFDIFDSLLFLRDTILKEIGKRIWGLTYTLYPDGKYEIEYDYNVPEGFNEKGEWVGEEYENGEVSEFFDNIRNIGTDDFELK
jgi:hypothetical protein